LTTSCATAGGVYAFFVEPTDDVNFWYIHVTCPRSQHQVTIGGSNTVSEFPSTVLLAIVLMLGALCVITAALALRRRQPAYPPPASAQPAPPTPAEKPKPSSLYCAHCGTENLSTNEYCGKCGQKLLRANL